AVPDLMGSDYIDKVTGTTPKPRTFRLRRSPDVNRMVADIERIYHETGISPAFLASIDYDDLQFLNDTVGMQVFGPLEQEMMKVLASRNYTKRVAALADYYYNQELLRRDLLRPMQELPADIKGLHRIQDAPVDDSEVFEFEGFQYPTEDWTRAVAAAHQLDDFASNENGTDDFFIRGLGIGLDMDAFDAARADILSSDAWIGRRIWDSFALTGGSMLGGIFDLLFRGIGAVGETVSAIGSVAGGPYVALEVDDPFGTAGEHLSKAKTWVTEGAEGFIPESKQKAVLRKGYRRNWNDP